MMDGKWIQLDIAQFRLDQGKWKVYWRDSKEKWHYVEDIIPDEDFEKQLEIVNSVAFKIMILNCAKTVKFQAFLANKKSP